MIKEIMQRDCGWDGLMEIKFLTDVQKVIEKLKEQEYQLTRIQHILRNAKANNKTVFICGNGGSASTATHIACDLFKIGGMRAISLGNNIPLMTAIINDNGWENLYSDQLKRLFNKGDVLISLSVHGGTGKDEADFWSQNLLKAIEYVNKNGGLTIGLSGFNGGRFKKMCNTNIVIPSKSTPIVESLHCLIGHLIASTIQTKEELCLEEKIKQK